MIGKLDVTELVYSQQDLLIKFQDIENLSVDIKCLTKSGKFPEKLQQLKEKREKVICHKKLRRTVIKGIPSGHIPHSIGGGEVPLTEKNIRAEVWRKMISLEDLKTDMVEDFNLKLDGKSTPQIGSLTVQQVQAVPSVGKCLDKPEQLFHFYKNMKFPNEKQEQKLYHDITVDLKRTDPGNQAYAQDHKSGKNPLYNVLMAYAHFDPEVSYCQGMNLITSWILKYT